MSSSKILLVEGRDDREVIYQISNYLSIQRNAFDVKALDGFENVLEWLTIELPIRIKASESQYIGIIVDADDDFNTNWYKVADRLKHVGYRSIPSNPPEGGILISESGMPLIGVWLMPNNRSAGILEDFIASLIPANDDLWSIAQKSVNELPKPHRFKPSYISKAYIHTWLAWQEEPGTPLGLAIIRPYLDKSHPVFYNLSEWLKQLFNL